MKINRLCPVLCLESTIESIKTEKRGLYNKKKFTAYRITGDDQCL